MQVARQPPALPLFAYLLLNVDTPLPRTTVAFTLWRDEDEETARSNLRRHLYELRRMLPPAANDCPGLFVDGGTVQWRTSA